MAIVRIVRFTARPEDAAEMIERRAALIAAARDVSGGLGATEPARLDERSWVDVWHWDSPESLRAVVAAELPEAAAAFALTADMEGVNGEVVAAGPAVDHIRRGSSSDISAAAATTNAPTSSAGVRPATNAAGLE